MNHLGSPSSARNAARERPRACAWADLTAELDHWAGSGRTASFWWRDDDAVTATPALDRLLALSERHSVPLALAVIPSRADRSLAEALARSSAPVTVLQHGFAHRNHAPADEKSQELGDHRNPDEAVIELERGREKLAALFGDRFVPAMVPPWNRIGGGVAAVLAGHGFRGLSTFGPREAAGGGRVNTHVDIIDWRGGGFAGEAACLAVAIGHLADRRAGRCDADEPTGLLTHHLVQDDACWRFVDRFLAEIGGHRSTRWMAPTAVFAEAGA